MNLIRESLENIKATEELKQNTLQYLRETCRLTPLSPPQSRPEIPIFCGKNI